MQTRFPWPLLPAVAIALLVSACGVAPTAPTASTAEREGERFAYRGGEVAVAPRGENCELTLRGTLAPAAVSSLTLAHEALSKRSCRSKWVVLDIADGSVGAAITVGSMLRNRGYNTRIAPGSACHTPCLLVFAAGAEREIPAGAPPARLGFSQIPPDEDFGKAGCETELDNRQLLNLARYLRAMLPATSADYMLQKIRATDCHSVRELPAREAVTAGLATKG